MREQKESRMTPRVFFLSKQKYGWGHQMRWGRPQVGSTRESRVRSGNAVAAYQVEIFSRQQDMQVWSLEERSKLVIYIWRLLAHSWYFKS